MKNVIEKMSCLNSTEIWCKDNGKEHINPKFFLAKARSRQVSVRWIFVIQDQ